MARQPEQHDFELRGTLLDSQTKLLLTLLRNGSLPEHVRNCIPSLAQLPNDRLEKLLRFGFLSEDAQLAAAWILYDREGGENNAAPE